jgi:hypothetical protein
MACWHAEGIVKAADYAFGFNPPYGLRADFSYFFSRTLGLLLFFGHKLADLLVTHGLKLTFWS